MPYATRTLVIFLDCSLRRRIMGLCDVRGVFVSGDRWLLALGHVRDAFVGDLEGNEDRLVGRDGLGKASANLIGGRREYALVLVRRILEVLDWLREGLAEIRLRIGRHALELPVEPPSLAQHHWQFLGAEDHKPQDEQKDDFAPRKIEHGPILKAVHGPLPIVENLLERTAVTTQPILFAHRGARGHAQENTIEAFDLALRLGATGLETDAWITSDDVVVLDHDGEVGSRFKRRAISQVEASSLPPHIPTLSDFCSRYRSHEISIDVKDVSAFDPLCAVMESSRIHRKQVWLCHPDLSVLEGWRPRTEFNLVHSTRYGRIAPGFESHAAQLARLGIDAINMPASEWSGGLIALYHRFSIRCFAWNVQYTEVAQPLVTSGIDALYGDFVDRLVDAVRR